ncbi:MAG TPA: type II secretion system protein, partial [Candidatus Ozemobacteraceae bacterium]|nr:type II secretion system protein [Candidatus Ozemobacteraceae bacterium]
MIIVVSVISILAVLAIPTVELFDMKARERLLRDRLYDMRLSIDRYRNARLDNLPPESVASLMNTIATVDSRSRLAEGPYRTSGLTINPFTPKND